MLPIVVLYDAVDARRFGNESPAVRAVCPLTPLAAANVSCAKVPVLDVRERYGDGAQADTIRLREHLRERWHEVIDAKGALDPSVRYVLDLALSTLLNGYDRLRHVIGNEGPWLVPMGEVWTAYTRRDEACRAISHHILARYPNFIGNIICHPAPFPVLFRAVRRVLVAFAKRAKPNWVTSRSDHPLGLERALLAAFPAARQFHLTTADAGWREYLRLFRELLRSLGRAPQIQVRAIPARRREHERQALTAIENFPDPEIRMLMRELSPHIANVSGIAGGASVDFGNILRQLQPNFMLASEIADALTVALFNACGESHIPRRVGSHNSFAPANDDVSLTALRYQLGGQYGDGAAEQNLFWNAPSLAAGKQVLSCSSNRCVALAAMAVSPVEKPRATERPFRILYATNSLRYFSGTSWMYEDVNEFVESVATLVNTGLSVENTNYTVRTKVRRHEMDESTIRAKLKGEGRVEVTFRHSRPFQDDLARADLLVAFRSTTIMQALFSRKPVLFWGVSPRYRELAGRTTPPLPGDRAAIYNVTRADDLPAMIRAIKHAHWAKPLTDEELAPYVLPSGTMSVDTWARECLTSVSA